MISLDSLIWKELDSAGSDTDEILHDLMEGKGDFHENMESLSWDLSHQTCYYNATAYVIPHLAVLCTKLSPEDKAFLIKEIGLAIAAEGAWPLEPDTEAFREFQEGLRGLRREAEELVVNPDIAAILGNDPTGERREVFALSALAVLGNRMHAYGMWNVFSSDWDECIGACFIGWEMKKRSSFCLLYMKRASAPAAEKERLTGTGWRSSSDMDGAADDMLLGVTDDSFHDAGFSSISIRME